MVFQRFNLFPHMTALQNITEAPTHVRGTSKDEASGHRASPARSRWARRESRRLPRRSSPAASSNASRSPARSP